MSKIKFIKVDFIRIAKEIFIITKNVVISDVDALIVNLDLINTKAKVMRKTHCNEGHNVIERIELLARRRKALQI